MSTSSTSNHHFLNLAKQIIPPLDGSLHKGQAGRIGIVGGSREYTGAPYFAGYAALRLGADLSHIICHPEASRVIKTYTPDLIVHGLLSSPEDQQLFSKNRDELQGLIKRLDVIIIGPGLGRDQDMLDWAEFIIQLSIVDQIPLVIDADGLWLIKSKPKLIYNCPSTILTPNLIEFQRLLEACKITKDNDQDNDNLDSLGSQLSKALGGCTIVEKSKIDVISKESHEIIKVDQVGSPKRSGGQGDILSGLIATWLSWSKTYSKQQKLTNIQKQEQEQQEQKNKEKNKELESLDLICCFMACSITRISSRKTYEILGRSMQSSDILNQIKNSFDEFLPN